MYHSARNESYTTVRAYTPHLPRLSICRALSYDVDRCTCATVPCTLLDSCPRSPHTLQSKTEITCVQLFYSTSHRVHYSLVSTSSVNVAQCANLSPSLSSPHRSCSLRPIVSTAHLHPVSTCQSQPALMWRRFALLYGYGLHLAMLAVQPKT